MFFYDELFMTLVSNLECYCPFNLVSNMYVDDYHFLSLPFSDVEKTTDKSSLAITV